MNRDLKKGDGRGERCMHIEREGRISIAAVFFTTKNANVEGLASS